jgi:hypothetical protein
MLGYSYMNFCTLQIFIPQMCDFSTTFSNVLQPTENCVKCFTIGGVIL